MKKRNAVLFLLAGLMVLTALTGCSIHKIYRNNYLTAITTDCEDGSKELSLSIELSSTDLTNTARKTITKDGPVTENLDIALSDGTHTGLDLSGVNPDTYAGTHYFVVYSSIADLEAVFDRNLLTSTMIAYPEGEKNLVLHYDAAEGDSFIFSVSVPIADDISVNEAIYMNFSGNPSHYTSNLSDVSADIQHETYTTAAGQEVELFVDETSGQACICAIENGISYVWKLTGPLTLDWVRQFSDTLA